MRVPQRGTRASRLHDEFGVYLETRLQGASDCPELLAQWTAAQERLRASVQANREAKVTAMRAIAIRDEADEALDLAVRMFHRAITAIVRNSARSGLMQTYFPNGSPAVTDALPRRELSLVESLLAKLAGETDTRLTGHLEELRAAHQRFQTEIEAHERAQQGARDATGLEQARRIEWLDAYRKIYHDLRSKYVADPERVERFFRSFEPSTSDPEEVEQELSGVTRGATTGEGTSGATTGLAVPTGTASGTGGGGAQ